MKLLRVSRRFIEAIKLADRPAYAIALKAGIHPSTLSKLLHGAERIRPEDPRVIAVARVLGLRPDECFDLPEMLTTAQLSERLQVSPGTLRRKAKAGALAGIEPVRLGQRGRAALRWRAAR